MNYGIFIFSQKNKKKNKIEEENNEMYIPENYCRDFLRSCRFLVEIIYFW